MNRTTAVQAPAPRAIQIARASSHVALGRRRRMLTRVVQSNRARVLAAFRSAANRGRPDERVLPLDRVRVGALSRLARTAVTQRYELFLDRNRTNTAAA
jgi:hypothetical protein